MRDSLKIARFFIWIVAAMIAKVGAAARHSHLIRSTAGGRSGVFVVRARMVIP
jgi:hypothetical protein